MSSGGETERVDPVATINITPPTPPQQQNAPPFTEDSKTPAVNVKEAEPAGAQQPEPAKPKTTAKRKPKKHRRRTS